MSGFGNPRHICSDCEKDLDDATLSKEPAVISEAIEKIGEKLQKANNDDELILKTVSTILEDARARGEMIKNGVYDFKNDELTDESDAEVPEELLETEEDKELDAEEKKTNEKFDKIFNWITLAIFLGFIIYFAYWFISTVF